MCSKYVHILDCTALHSRHTDGIIKNGFIAVGTQNGHLREKSTVNFWKITQFSAYYTKTCFNNQQLNFLLIWTAPKQRGKSRKTRGKERLRTPALWKASSQRLLHTKRKSMLSSIKHRLHGDCTLPLTAR